MSLVAYYKLDERSGTAINDFVGSNTGTSVNTVVPISSPPGMGLVFNGSTDKITIPADSSIDINGKTKLTILGWINPASAGENNLGNIVNKANGAVRGYKFELFGTPSALKFQLIFSGTDSKVRTGNIITFDTWLFVGAVYNEDGDKKSKLYINGILQSLDVDDTGVGSIVDDSTQDLVIGNREDNDRTFDGALSDIRIYSDEAFSQARIIQAMQDSIYDRTLRNRFRR